MRKVLLFLTALLGLNASAQTIKLEIQTETGDVVPFATIHQRNSKKAWVADASGEFYYQLFSEADTLEIQSLGFEKKLFIVNSMMKSPQKVLMNPSYNQLAAVEIQGAGAHAFGFTRESIAASSVLIDEKALAKLETNDVNQVMMAIPGVQVQQEDGFGLRPNIGMRGTGVERSSKITLMEDGVLVAPAPYTASAAYFFPSMDHVEAVEVLKGSSQIAYGPQTNGGAINLITDRIPQGFEGKARVSAGSYLTRKVQGYVGGSEENFGYLLKGTYFGSNGFKELPNGANTGFDRGDVLAKLRFNTKADAAIYQSFTVKFGYTQENTNETYLGLSLDDFENNPIQRYITSALDNIKSRHTQIQLNHLIQPIDGLNVSTTIYLNRFERDWFKLDKVSVNGSDKLGISAILDDPDGFEAEMNLIRGDFYTAANLLDLKHNNRAYNSKGIQSNLTYKFKTGGINHLLSWGIRAHADEMDRFQWVDEYSLRDDELVLLNKGIPGSESNRIESARALASYLQYSLKFGKLTFNPGLRFETMKFQKDDYGKSDTDRLGADLEVIRNTTNVFLPGVSANYELTERNYLFLGAHKGFSPPNSNPETRPEESWNFELGSKGMVKGFAYELIGFANRYTNLLGSDLNAIGGAGSTDLFNGGEVNVYGLEAMFAYNLLAKFSDKLRLPFNASYTYTNARFQRNFESDGPWGVVQSGDFLPFVANHQGFLQMGLEHKRFDLNLVSKLVGFMRTNPSHGEKVYESSTPFFYQLDLLVRFQAHEALSVYMKWNNLTNNVQRVANRPAGWRPNMPMYIEGGFDVQF